MSPLARRLSREFWVGLFTMIGILLFVMVTISLRNWNLLSRRDTYYLSFKQVRQLDVGAPVLVYGVQVGSVTRIEYIKGEHPVLVTIQIDDSVALYEDARASVAPTGVIGDTTINIESGDSSGKTLVLPPGATIVAEAAPAYDEMAQEISGELTRTLRAAGDLLSDPETRTAFKRTMTNLASASEKFNTTLDVVNADLRPLIVDLRQTSARVNGFLDDAHKLTGGAQTQLDETAGSLREASAAWRQAAQNLDAQLTRTAAGLDALRAELLGSVTENRAPLRQTLNELAAASEALRAIGQKLASGEGTLGLMINDPRLFEQLSTTINALSQRLTGRRDPAFLAPLEGAPSAQPRSSRTRSARPATSTTREAER